MSALPFVPPGASVEAAAVDSVLTAIHVHIAIIAAVWSALFVYVLVRFRRRSGLAPAPRGPGLLWPLIAIGAVIAGDVIILASKALPSWSARLTPPPASLRPVSIRVVGEQFAWNVHYPGPDGEFGPTRAQLISASNPLGIDRTASAARDDIGLLNVLTVPVDRPIVLELSSRDVVHSLTLVPMRVKQDMNPGMTTRTWFTPTRTGRWDISCSQLCGLGHYRMKGTLTVLNEEEWSQWEAAEVARLTAARPQG